MDWSKFFSMGGYGLYVWGSYLSSLLILGIEMVVLMKRHKVLQKRVNKNKS
jgi:heme exporter protein D